MLNTNSQSTKYVLKDVNINDGKGGRKKGVNVVIENNLIKDILDKDIMIDNDLPKYDFAGKWIMPGMIDLHVHLSAETGNNKRGIPANYWRLETFSSLKVLHAARNAYVSMMAGFTTLRNCGHVSYYEPEDIALRDGINKGLLYGPRIIASAGSLTMTAGHGDLAMSRTLRRAPELGYGDKCFDGVWECLQGVREKVRIGADFIKVMASGGMSSGGDKSEWPNFQVNELKSIVLEAKSLDRKVAAHAQGRLSLERVIEAGVDTIEHGCYLDKSLCSIMAQKGIFLVPTLRVVNVLTNSPDLQEREKARKLSEVHNIAINSAIEEGVKIAFGTDSLNSLKHGENALELLELSNVGISNMELIKCITSNSAEALGLQDEIGFIGEGMIADIIITDNDPMEDITILTEPSNIKMVISNGKIVKNLI